MKGCISTIFILIVLVFTGSCSSSSVYHDYSEEVNYSEYRTFGWMTEIESEDSGNIAFRSLMDARIKRAVERELRAKGYTFVEGQTPDIFIAYNIGLPERYDYESGNKAEDISGKDGDYGNTLTLDFIDSKRDEIIWRGRYKDAVEDPEKADSQINNAVSQVLAEYPPLNG